MIFLKLLLVKIYLFFASLKKKLIKKYLNFVPKLNRCKYLIKKITRFKFEFIVYYAIINFTFYAQIIKI